MHLHEVEALLARRGWYLDRHAGDHRQYKNERGQLVTIALQHGRRNLNWRQVAQIERDLANRAAEWKRYTAPVPPPTASKAPETAPARLRAPSALPHWQRDTRERVPILLTPLRSLTAPSTRPPKTDSSTNPWADLTPMAVARTSIYLPPSKRRDYCTSCGAPLPAWKDALYTQEEEAIAIQNDTAFRKTFVRERHTLGAIPPPVMTARFCMRCFCQQLQEVIAHSLPPDKLDGLREDLAILDRTSPGHPIAIIGVVDEDGIFVSLVFTDDMTRVPWEIEKARREAADIHAEAAVDEGVEAAAEAAAG